LENHGRQLNEKTLRSEKVMEVEDEVRRLIDVSDLVDFSSFGEGVSEARISGAEKTIGTSFSPSYRWWLKNYGGGEIDGEEVYGVYDIDNVQGGGDIAYMWAVNKNNHVAAEYQLFVLKAGNDEAFYFKLDERRSDGEYPIYRYDYVEGTHTLYADDFFVFLKKKIR
jgi:hypothetical protein